MLLVALSACKPAARGLCTVQADCHEGSFCSQDGICLGSSADCSPACSTAEVCSAQACVALKPSLQILLAAGAVLSPSQAQVKVHVEASPSLALHALVVEAADSDMHVVASGSVAGSPGDLVVTLGSFEPNRAATVTVSASITWDPPSGASQIVRSPVVQAMLDDQLPNLSISVAAAADAVEGWMPRTSGNVEVDAHVDDGQGSGPSSATLTFDVCPGAAPCSYAGVEQGGGNFSFQVPRMAQAPGVASPLSFTVKAKDKGGNESKATGKLLIDDSAPSIGAISLITPGATGEDGKTWFIGGASAPQVEIALPVSDTGVGLASVSLDLLVDDVVSGTPLHIDAVTPPPADGMTHFRLPASAVRGREGHLRFSLTATDRLQHTTVAGPSDSTAIWVDDAPPTVSAPRVDYTSATPGFTAVCGAGTECGRGLQATPDHLLRDDAATVSFDVTDCGIGIGAPPTASATSGGITSSVTVSANGKSGTPCAASTNQTHHYTFTLSLPDVAAALDAPDATGTSLVQLAALGSDQFGHAAPGAAVTSGDGLALVSLVRWRTQLRGVMAGSPALVPVTGGGPRQIAVGTDASSSGANLYVLNADGSRAWTSAVSPGIVGDLALGPAGNLYAVYPGATGCTGNCGTFNIIPLPTSPVATVAALPCAITAAAFGPPPAITSAGSTEIAVVAAPAHDVSKDNIYVFQLNGSQCQNVFSNSIPLLTNPLSGVSVSPSTWFFSHSAGFTSVAKKNNGFDGTTAVSFNGSAPALAGPGVSSNSSVDVFFGGGTGDKAMHRTQKVTSVTTTWKDVSGFPTQADSILPYTPVFDGSSLYAADDQGKVYAWSESTGSLLWSRALGGAASAPVLMQNGSLLVVKKDGTVALVSQAGILPLVKLNAFSPQSPSPPAVDQRTTAWGVAYVGDGAGWVNAVQLPTVPVLATGTVWPRPGRDSCNSRNAGAVCQ